MYICCKSCSQHPAPGERERSRSAVVSSERPHCGWNHSQSFDGAKPNPEEWTQRLTCMYRAKEESSQACSSVTFTHHLAASPCDARSHSAHRLFRAPCVFSQSHPHAAALDSPNIKHAAYLYLYCVYQSGSHYSCAADVRLLWRDAINTRPLEHSGRNSQLMIKKWQLASFIFYCRLTAERKERFTERLLLENQPQGSKTRHETHYETHL